MYNNEVAVVHDIFQLFLLSSYNLKYMKSFGFTLLVDGPHSVQFFFENTIMASIRILGLWADHDQWTNRA
jgi:hypothetical protein